MACASLTEAAEDELEVVIGEVAPRIWCVLQEQMQKDSKNDIYLNAVINATLFAVLGWVAACTPKDTEGVNDDILRKKVMQNLDNAFENSRSNGSEMSMMAHNVGKLKLMEDSMQGLATVLTQNSMVIKGVHAAIMNNGKPKT